VKSLSNLRLPFLILTIAVAVLAPAIPITATFQLRPEFIMAGILFLWLLPSEGLTILKHPVFKWMGLLAGLIAISLGFSVLVIGRPISLQDMFEVAKVGVYAVVFYAASAMTIDGRQFSRAYVWIQGIFSASAVIGIFQYFNLLDINLHFSILYTHPSIGRELAGNRIVGTTSNPNYYAMMMLFGICLAIAGLLWTRESRLRWFSAASLLACTASMLLAASRTVMAVTPLPVLFIAIHYIIRSRGDKAKLQRFGAIAAGSLAIMIIILLLLPSTWFLRMGELLNILESESFSGKLVHWRDHWEMYLRSPIFGWGPAKGLISLNVDNEWLLFLVRYGIGGPILAFILGFSLYRASNDLKGTASTLEVGGFAIALQAILLALPVFMVTAAIYHHQQLMAILLLVVGLGQGVLRGLDTGQTTGLEEISPA
jgi:hypothetical protein